MKHNIIDEFIGNILNLIEISRILNLININALTLQVRGSLYLHIYI